MPQLNGSHHVERFITDGSFAILVEIVLWFAYFIHGNTLNRRAIGRIVDPEKRASTLALFDSRALGEEGRALRRQAIQFWLVGGALLLLVLLLLGYLQVD